MCYGNANVETDRNTEGKTIVAMEIAGAEAIPECNTNPVEIDQTKRED